MFATVITVGAFYMAYRNKNNDPLYKGRKLPYITNSPWFVAPLIIGIIAFYTLVQQLYLSHYDEQNNLYFASLGTGAIVSTATMGFRNPNSSI